MSRISFHIRPRPPFRLDLTVWTLRRRPDNAMDRWDGHTYRRVLLMPTGPAEVAVTQVEPPETPRLRAVVEDRQVSTLVKGGVASALERLLGLSIDLGEFYRFAEGQDQLGQLVRRFRGMKPPRFATVFESVINGIASQQVSRTVAILVLNRLTARYGAAVRDENNAGRAFARPEDLAGLQPDDLRQIGLSRQKGRSNFELAKTFAEMEDWILKGLPNHLKRRSRAHLVTGGRALDCRIFLLRGLGHTHVFPGDD